MSRLVVTDLKDFHHSAYKLRDYLNDHKDEPLESVIQNFSEKHNIQPDITKSYYDLMLKEQNNEPDIKLASLEKEPQVGDIFEVIIEEVRSYGFIVTTEHNYRGLVHIKEVANGFIEFLDDYGRIGDKYFAKVIHIDEKGLSMSFRALGGLKPDYRKDKFKSHPQLDKITENAGRISLNRLQKEEQKVLSLVSEAAGEISIRAKHEFLRLIRSHGIVEVTLKLQEVLRDLDEGVLIAKIVENKILGSDTDYIVSSHAITNYIERTGLNISREEAETAIIDKCRNGGLISDSGYVRFIRHGELVFPCVSVANGWKVKTTLLYEMIINKTIDQLTKEYY
ncbi:MAG: S1 RNA-binding domain-containing protein [Clostridia bacterium]|nr:S1 RNA-binding domain-containing protein [Clostridia bacterium]